ncbi:MAG: DUF3592 domain-containing protein [Terriglobales bacterium]
MPGWYLDIIVGYIVRITMRTLKARGSGRWPLQKAKVTGSNCEYSASGGQVAEVTYAWNRDGEYFSGMYKEPSLLLSSAVEYAARFPAGGDVIIRVKPSHPEMSIIRDSDQSWGMFSK